GETVRSDTRGVDGRLAAPLALVADDRLNLGDGLFEPAIRVDDRVVEFRLKPELSLGVREPIAHLGFAFRRPADPPTTQRVAVARLHDNQDGRGHVAAT